MTEEQKQALIDWLREGIELREEYGFNGNLLASMRIALAALTAPPVKLAKNLKLSDKAHQSHIDYAEGYNDRAEMDRDAIRAAGYQVEGE